MSDVDVYRRLYGNAMVPVQSQGIDMYAID